MKCIRCGGKLENKTGTVYGQPQQKTEFTQCTKCNLINDHRVAGIRIFDEHDKEGKIIKGADK